MYANRRNFRVFWKSGSRNTTVTSDFRPEVEIRPFHACAMHPGIMIGTVRSLWTWLWGRYHVPQNVFLVVRNRLATFRMTSRSPYWMTVWPIANVISRHLLYSFHIYNLYNLNRCNEVYRSLRHVTIKSRDITYTWRRRWVAASRDRRWRESSRQYHDWKIHESNGRQRTLIEPKHAHFTDS